MVLIMIIIYSVLFSIIGFLLYKQYKKKFNISFKEAMELVELPIITFYNKGQKLNFLLDTGSNDCIIDSSNLSKLETVKMQQIKPIFGMEGNIIEGNIYKIGIERQGYLFESTFNALDLNEVFGIIKKESGVQIHGILGSNFFQKYKYILDFKDLMCYIR